MIGIADEVSGGSVVLTLPYLYVHKGGMYEASYKTPDGSPLADNDNLDFLFRTSDVHCHLSIGPIAANPIEVLFYEDPVITNVGTAMNVVGLNRVRSLASTALVYRSPTNSSVGNTMRSSLQIWGIAPLVPAFSEIPWILRPNTDYLFSMINRAGSAQDVAMIIQWFEDGN